MQKCRIYGICQEASSISDRDKTIDKKIEEIKILVPEAERMLYIWGRDLIDIKYLEIRYSGRPLFRDRIAIVMLKEQKHDYQKGYFIEVRYAGFDKDKGIYHPGLDAALTYLPQATSSILFCGKWRETIPTKIESIKVCGTPLLDDRMIREELSAAHAGEGARGSFQTLDVLTSFRVIIGREKYEEVSREVRIRGF